MNEMNARCEDCGRDMVAHDAVYGGVKCCDCAPAVALCGGPGSGVPGPCAAGAAAGSAPKWSARAKAFVKESPKTDVPMQRSVMPKAAPKASPKLKVSVSGTARVIGSLAMQRLVHAAIGAGEPDVDDDVALLDDARRFSWDDWNSKHKSEGRKPSAKPEATPKPQAAAGKGSSTSDAKRRTDVAARLQAIRSVATQTISKLPDMDHWQKDYTAAQQAGFKGSMEGFVLKQAALYQHAQEGDPRLATYFTGDSLKAIMANPTLGPVVQKLAQRQQAPPPAPAPVPPSPPPPPAPVPPPPAPQPVPIHQPVSQPREVAAAETPVTTSADHPPNPNKIAAPKGSAPSFGGMHIGAINFGDEEDEAALADWKPKG